MKHILALCLLVGFLEADERGREIITRITEIMSPPNSKGLVTQTIETSSGKTRTFEMEMYSGNQGEKSLMRYTEPSVVRGQTFLMLNNADDIWTYFPRTKRVRKLASHAKKQSAQGSDFSYEDMGGGDTWLEDFLPEYQGEAEYAGEACWRVELTKNPEADVSYSKMIVWARTTDYYPVYIEYYDENGRHTKSAIMEDIQVIEDFPTAMKMTMLNHSKHSQTVMETLSITYDWQPPPDFFSERSLKQ